MLVVALLSASTQTLWGGPVAADEVTLEDIVAPESGYNKVVHYEFKDEYNLGKDSCGNFDLVAKNVAIDSINGGVALKDNGMLYAPALTDVVADEYTDFSDLVKGSFSVSFRAYLCNVNGGGHYLITTGTYGSSFTLDWAYSGLGSHFGNGQSKDFQNIFTNDFAWYRVNYIYNESDMTITVTATREGDDAFSYEGKMDLTQKITFGGTSNYSFTIGAQSHLGGWDAQHTTGAKGDGTTIAPNISDFRLYSGVIDDAEIANIKAYDEANATGAKTYEKNPLASYPFANIDSVGKDAMGNVNLVLKSNSADDYSLENGELTLKNGNLLYAENLGNGKDIADYLDTFTFAFDVKMANPGGGEFDILSAGKYGEALRVTRNGNHLNFYVGGGKNEWKENVFLDNEWQTVIVTGSVSDKYMAIYVNRPGDTQATLVASVSGVDGLALANNCCLTFGGDSKFGGEDLNHSNPTLRNIQIFDFAFGSAQANQYLSTGKVEVEATPMEALKMVTTTLKVDFSMSEEDILACDLPKTAQVVNAAGNTVEARIVWTKVEKGKYSAKVTGFLLGSAVNNQQNVVVELTVPYIFGDEYKQEIKPLVWYEFKDANNIGKDSMGNFDLLLGGNGNVTHNAEEGYVQFERANASYLYAPAIYGSSDWSDMLKGGYTFSYTVKADNSIGDGSYYAVTTGTYGKSFLIYGCYSGFEVIYSAGGASSHKLRFETGSYADRWVTITVTVDPTTSLCGFYINGTLFAEREIGDYRGFSADSLYSFVIGGQATVIGNDGTQFFEGAIADVKVYDYVLSADNVKDMYENSTFTSVPTYETVEKVEVDTTDVDLVLSGNNTVEDILASLPATVTVTSNDGNTETCPVIWLGRDGNVIKGYVQGCSWANTGSQMATVKLDYVVDFEDVSNGQFTDIKVNGTDYKDAALPVGEDATVTFKVVPNGGYKVASVVCNGEKLEPNNGLYTVSVADYSKIVAYISAEEYKITYVLNNGEDDEEQIYGYGEDVELATYFTKDGYTFAGWYLNADFSGEKVTTIDSTNPENVTLYAKWIAEGTTDPGDKGDEGDNANKNDPGTPNDPADNDNSGSSAVVIVVVAVVVVAAAAVVVIILMKKRGNR